MLVEAEIAAELAAHKGKRPLDHGARRFDLVDRVRGLELHPIDSGLLAVSLQPRDRVVERATGGVASVTLRHHHEIRVELVLHVDRSAVAYQRIAQWHNIDPGVLRLPFAFDRLVVDADAG